MPLKVIQLIVNHGNIHYIDPGSKPVVELLMTVTHLQEERLSNVVDSSKLPSSIHSTANVSRVFLHFDMNLNLLAAEPFF